MKEVMLVLGDGFVAAQNEHSNDAPTPEAESSGVGLQKGTYHSTPPSTEIVRAIILHSK